jgi:hypothetical protein
MRGGRGSKAVGSATKPRNIRNMKLYESRADALDAAEESVRAANHPTYCNGVSVRTDDLTASHVVEGECVRATCENCPRTAHAKYR